MLLNDSNYSKWRASMKGLLATKDCLDAITVAASPNSGKAVGIISQNVEDQFLHAAETADNSKALWDTFEQMYQQLNTTN